MLDDARRSPMRWRSRLVFGKITNAHQRPQLSHGEAITAAMLDQIRIVLTTPRSPL